MNVNLKKRHNNKGKKEQEKIAKNVNFNFRTILKNLTGYPRNGFVES